MSKFINSNTYKNKIAGEKIGTISLSMYKDKITSLPFFFIQLDNLDNDDMLQVSYIIEDTLKMF